MTKVVLLKLAFLGFYKVIKQGVLLIQDFPSALVLYFGQYLQGYLSMFTAGSRSSLLGCAWLCLVMASSRLSIKTYRYLKTVSPDNALFSPYLQGLLYKYHWTFKTGFPSSGSLWPSKVFVQGSTGLHGVRFLL
ncbi:uncharacterized protein B0P05DRAFT_642521 [Gilbertella persicaria]|uniref:uncharacterized protein n=1 Tax=Gilbertella persicaria TaxID=101096 RepID=UPI00221F7651|nr:uncharacterized protein B0P05DRAFT_642521 [Gilbertella persicaria]KAI8046958.1 hypothetical protein B0P05DRAFT_642521 [Gilbertella persicaria]